MNILTSAMFNPSALKPKRSFNEALSLAGVNPLNFFGGGSNSTVTPKLPVAPSYNLGTVFGESSGFGSLSNILSPKTNIFTGLNLSKPRQLSTTEGFEELPDEQFVDLTGEAPVVAADKGSGNEYVDTMMDKLKANGASQEILDNYMQQYKLLGLVKD